MPGKSYVFILDNTEHRRIYLDAGGSLSAVFDPDSLLCASTTGLLLPADEYSRRFNRELYDHLRVSDDGKPTPGRTDRTSRDQQAAREPLPGSARRRAAPATGRSSPAGSRPADPDEACTTINAVIARTMKTLQTAGRSRPTLTAGGGTAPRPRRLQGVQGLPSPVHPGGRARGPPRCAGGRVSWLAPSDYGTRCCRSGLRTPTERRSGARD